MRLLFAALLVTAAIAINHIDLIKADVSSLTSERKINLEDIERDTLINEIRSKSQETLHAEPTEHIPPTGVSGNSIQHTGPTAATPSSAPGGGAVSHQTIVYHQNTGAHPQEFQHGPSGPSAPPGHYQTGITYAQSAPQYPQTAPQYHQSAPASPTFHYSHSAPASVAPQPQQHQQQQQQYVQQSIHAQPQVLSHQPVVYYSHHAHYQQEPVQYVTIQQQPQQHLSHIASNLIAPVPQVHEEGRTYSAPSRHTLEVATQQQKHFKAQPPRLPVGFRPKPALISPQPQYVYVQANNVASAQQQRQYQQKFQQQQQAPSLPPPQQQQPQRPVHNVEIIQSQGQQLGGVEYVPQQSGVSYSQTTPYFQYSGSFGHPQAVPQHSSVPVNNNYVVVPYTTNPNVYHQHHQPAAPAPLSAPAPQQVVQEVPHYVQPTSTKAVIPSGPPQLFLQPQHHAYAPHPYHPHVPSYPTVSYAPSSYPGNNYPFGGHHGHSSYSNYFQPTLDFFGPYARHTSLLDSYVPSNLIYSKSRQHYQQYYAPHQTAALAAAPAPAPISHHHHQIETDPSQLYNTIAYSTEQKPVVVPPPSPSAAVGTAPPGKTTSNVSKRESTVLRTANKPMTITKIENVKFANKKN